MEQNTYWSRTTTSSCWVYWHAKRRARSLASELSGKKRCNCTLENAFFKEYERATEYSPRVNKVEDTQFLGEGSSQAVSIQDYVVMQESWICVQDVHLSCCSLCDGGVTMTHLEKHTYNMSVRALKRPATRWQKCNTLYFFNWLEKTDLRLDDNVLPCWTLLIQSK